jgi:hypothetical protein
MRFALPALCLCIVVLTAVAGGSASAGPALDDDKAKHPALAPVSEVDCTKPGNEAQCPREPRLIERSDDVEYGLGIRLRSVWVPKAVLQLFLERAAGGAQNFGYGVDLTRRHGTTELQLGFEYEHVNVGEGVWINKGDNVATPPNGPGDEADYVLSPDHSGHQLGWFTIEFTFLNHAEINKTFSIRYGGGIGIGVLTGELDHYNIMCSNATNSAPEPGCVPTRFQGNGTYSEGMETQVAYDLPPVFPVVNAILGLQIKPTDKLTINLEGGIRTLPFLGLSSAYFF